MKKKSKDNFWYEISINLLYLKTSDWKCKNVQLNCNSLLITKLDLIDVFYKFDLLIV